MSAKQFYHDIDLVKVGQLINARIHNVTSAEQTALAATLGPANKGLPVYNTEIPAVLFWDGAQFVQQAVSVTGGMIFRGVLVAADYDQNDGGYTSGPANTDAGDQYAIGEAGTIDLPGVTVNPDANVEVGDIVLFSDSGTAYVLQRNDSQATETVAGNVKLATTAVALAGANDTDAITALKLQQKLDQQNYTRGHFEVVTTVALTPYTITHGLSLVDKDAFTINLMDSAGSQVQADVDSVNTDSLTITTFIAVTDLHVTVTGIPADQ
jgi:plasmid maintenance system antidote protein VapI